MNNKSVWSYPGVLSTYNLSIKTFYYEIPLLAKYFIPRSDSKIALYFGPSIHFCLAGKVNRSFVRKIDNAYARGETDELLFHEISFIEDSGTVLAIFDNSSFGSNFRGQYRVFGITTECRYNITKLGDLDAVEFDKIFHTLSFIISF